MMLVCIFLASQFEAFVPGLKRTSSRCLRWHSQRKERHAHAKGRIRQPIFWAEESWASALVAKPNSGPRLYLALSHPTSAVLEHKTYLAFVAAQEGRDPEQVL